MCIYRYDDTGKTRKVDVSWIIKAATENLRKLPSLRWQYFTTEERLIVFYPALNFQSCVLPSALDYRIRQTIL